MRHRVCSDRPYPIQTGEGLGIEKSSGAPLLEPVLQYQIILPEGCDPRAMLPKLRQIEDEEPELNIVWDEQLQEIRVRVMGEVQIEILQSIIKAVLELMLLLTTEV